MKKMKMMKNNKLLKNVAGPNQRYLNERMPADVRNPSMFVSLLFELRGWLDNANVTVSQRKQEGMLFPLAGT